MSRRSFIPASPSIWSGVQPEAEASASVMATLRLLRSRLPFLVLWILGFVVCGVAYVKLMRPDYIASTQILLQPRVVVNDGPEDLRHYYQFMIDSDQCETELQILRSEQILSRVFAIRNLVDAPEIRGGADGVLDILSRMLNRFDRLGKPTSPADATIEAYQAFVGRIRVRRLSLSYVIEISYRARTAEQATQVVNAIASAYAAYRLRGVLAREQRRGAYLENRQASLQEQILAAEAGIRFGVIPENRLPDSDVRLLGPANLPLGSVFPRTTPLLMLMVIYGTTTGLLIVLLSRRPALRHSEQADMPISYSRV